MPSTSWYVNAYFLRHKDFTNSYKGPPAINEYVLAFPNENIFHIVQEASLTEKSQD